MSNYTKLTDYASKDALTSGNPSKLIKGTEIDADFLSIQTNMATKIDATTASSPTVVTSLADADQVRIWQNSGSAEKQITAANAALYFGTRIAYTGYASLSGTSITSPAIPATARKIVVQLNAFSLNSSADYRIRVADSGGTISSGYNSGDGRVSGTNTGDKLTSTTGFDIFNGASGRSLTGMMTLILMDSTNKLWTANWDFVDAIAPKVHSGAGLVTLSAASAIQNIVFTSTSGAATLSGSYNVAYE